MHKSVLFAVVLSGCASCEPIDLGGCAAFEEPPCEEYTQDGASCVPSRATCPLSKCQCSDGYVVVCPADLSVPHDLSPPADLSPPDDDGGFDDGGFGDGG